MTTTKNTAAAQASCYQQLRAHLAVLKLHDAAEHLPAVLESGRFRLVIAVDQITEDLRRSVEFLNDHSTDDVIFLALELGYFSRHGVEILASETYGAEVETSGKGKGPSAAGKPRWTSEEISRAAKEIPDPRSKELVERALRHAENNAAVIKGGQGARVSAGFYYSVGSKRPSLWSLWLGDNPEISLNIGSVANVSQDIAKHAFDALLSSPSLVEIVGSDFGAVAGKYPSVALSKIADDPTALPAILGFLDAPIHTLLDT